MTNYHRVFLLGEINEDYKPKIKQIIKEELNKVMLEADMSRQQAMALAHKRLKDADEEYHEDQMKILKTLSKRRSRPS